MRKLSTLALLGAIFLAPSLGNAACGDTCGVKPACKPACKTVAAPVCTQPVCQTCTCCPVIKGFANGGNRSWY